MLLTPKIVKYTFASQQVASSVMANTPAKTCKMQGTLTVVGVDKYSYT